MLTSEIIEKFNLYVDDSSELSSSEELDLANKIYKKVLNFKDWEFLKKAHTDTMSTSVDYIALPADFRSIAINYELYDEPAQVIFVGTDYEPYRIIPFSNRRSYRNQKGYAYIDARQSRLYFTKQPDEAKSIEFDYIYKPDDLTLATSPVFSEDYHDIVYHGMVLDFYSIDMTPKGETYDSENQAAYVDYLEAMSEDDFKFYGGLSY